MKLFSIITLSSMTVLGTIIPQSGEKVLIGDAEYILISNSDYANITNTIFHLKSVAADRLRREMDTENGRIFWHGRKVGSYFTNDVFVIEYADGYRHETKVKHKKSSRISERFRQIKRPTMPNGLENIRSRRQNALSKTNEVSVTIER